ncbi:hypothetical protein ERJ75_001827900 [Trypanosoma vivax]|uniref:Uncharacterized protein n=1 Tax=Trypanosoma vivax (strain Y486) TaxID=1055687 RepID=G0U915_TRYVY|nr:hypothetical protein ERJ75_001827900 [Trypanosoma vivax]CCC54098.1 conserved hypothetical protein [Trypanosoma vivax Y486]
MDSDKQEKASCSNVYKRGRDDNSLWDDGELIRLWNMQLERQHQGNEECSNSDKSASSGSTASSDDGGSRISSPSRAFVEVSTAHVAKQSNAPKCASPIAEASSVDSVLPEDVSGLPRAIRRIATAYYRAGYEAGFYVGRTQGKGNRR